MRNWLSAALLGAVLLGAGAQAWALTAELTYTPVDQDRLYFGSHAQAQWQLSPPAGEWKFPEAVGSNPMYGTITLGETTVPIMVDRKDAADKFYSRAWIDTDGDGDLAEETPVESRLRPGVQYPPGYGMFESGGVDLTYSLEGAQYPYRIALMLQCSQVDRLGTINAQNLEGMVQGYIRGMSTWAAQCEVAGKTLSFTLVDQNADGRFGEMVSDRSTMAGGSAYQPLYARSDQLFVTPAGAQPSYYDNMPLTGMLWIDGGLQKVGVDLAGRKLNLEPAEGAVELTLPAGTTRLVMLGTGGTESVAYIDPPSSVRIPAGYYRLLSVQMERKDSEGDDWRVTSAGSNRTPRYVMREGEKAELSYGEPFTPVVTARSSGNAQSAEVRFDLSVRGSGQEQIQNIEHRGNATKIPLEQGGSRPKAPTWQVVRPDGERVASGSFEYG